MKNITNHGKPTMRTPGSVGDIYTDINTGIQYQCVYSYHDSGGVTECRWKEIGKKTELKTEEKTKAQVPIQENQRVNYSKQYQKNRR